MKVSLIMGTLGRSTELGRFLVSLDRQTHRDFELIVVDQNPDRRLDPILRMYDGHFAIKHVRTNTPGLSRSRNQGLKYLQNDADLLAFPDDDCWYPRVLLEQVTGFLNAHSHVGGVSGVCATTRGSPRGRWAREARFISKYRIFGRCISFTMFFRKSLVDKVGLFDETLGLGPDVRWPGAEDFDYLLRAASADPLSPIFYSREFRVFHDDLPITFDERKTVRRYSDAKGFGRFLRKHQYPCAFLYYYSSRYVADAAICYLRGNMAKATYRWNAFLGMHRGYWDETHSSALFKRTAGNWTAHH